ncbi:MAG: DUF2804 family protein, partial [Deltaproteobacteria bacterium]
MEKQSLIGANGRPNFGIYDTPLVDLSLEPLRLYGKQWSNNIARKFVLSYRIKRWEYVGACNEQVVFGVAVVNLGYMSTMFAYVFDRITKQLEKFETVLPCDSSVLFVGSSAEGSVNFEHGSSKVNIVHKGNRKTVQLFIGKNFSANMEMENSSAPMVYVGRVGLQGFNYTHKEAGMPVSGKISVGAKEWELLPSNSFGVMDYTV